MSFKNENDLQIFGILLNRQLPDCDALGRYEEEYITSHHRNDKTREINDYDLFVI